MRALVTGANGFAGSHLVQLLLGEGWEVLGITNDVRLNPHLNATSGNFTLEEVDICDRRRLVPLVRKFAPERVFHLAAVTLKDVSRVAVDELYRVNVQGTQNLFFSTLEAKLEPFVLVTGSSASYGPLSSVDDRPLAEDSALCPQSIYGASKLAQEVFSASFGTSTGLDVARTRAFNHTGPGEGSHMACSSFARQIAECELGRGSVIEVGNLDSYRDYCDVRDVVQAYLLVATRSRAGEVFNVCSGRAVCMRAIVELLVSMSTKRISVSEDSSRHRAADVSYQRGDYTKIRNTLGWEPRIPLEKSMSDLLDYWRSRLKEDGPNLSSRAAERRTP
ncbi:MAG: GDP-mannose 4,6-dehydratase [Candidatus Eisenbacteria bacterium]|nr:GDP-mannose 4,6-dehydratase [Candidatus Eisenbacteria bacterium]